MRLLYYDVDCIIFDYIGWGYISQNWKLSSDFIELYANRLPFYHLSQFQKLSVEIMEKYHYKLDWHKISKYQTLPIEFIDRHHHRLNWKHLPRYQKLTIEIMEKYHKQYNYNWHAISEYQVLTEDFIRKFSKNFDWGLITANQNLSEEFMIEFKDKIKWNKLPMNKEYSNAFISVVGKLLPVYSKEKINYFNDISAYANMNNPNYWNHISKSVKLNENIINKYQNMVNWGYIFLYQDLSDTFVEKFKHKIDINYILDHTSMGERFIKKHWNAINWGDLLHCFPNWYEQIGIYRRKYPILWDIISKFKMHDVNLDFILQYQYYLKWDIIPQEIIIFVYNHYYSNFGYNLDLKYIPNYIQKIFKQHVFPPSLVFPKLLPKIYKSKYIIATLSSPLKAEKDSMIIINDYNGFIRKLNNKYILIKN